MHSTLRGKKQELFLEKTAHPALYFFGVAALYRYTHTFPCMTRQEFEQTVPEMREVMLAIGRDFFGNEMDAEDVAQDGLLTLWRYCERMDAGHSVKPLAINVAKHCCIDIMRRRRTTIALDDPTLPQLHRTGDGPHETMEALELRQALDSAIEGLAPSERQLFRLRQLEGLSLDEIAELTHIPKTSAKSMISAARRKLYEALKKRDLINSKP